ncbi:MAG: hypothetical protein M9945_14025 [Aquamicrobium sp.]|uniref:DUF5983 family protein n=1 Tax=Aquamicrobium sp. TaxID=1872579 RepID=UPI00349EB8B2|nr:hypothetical protein [Aquamicrobium sp.]
MAEFAEPTFNQILHVTGLAQAYAESIDDEDEDQPSEWEWEAIQKVREWAAALEHLDEESQVQLALDVLKKHGMPAAPLGPNAMHVETCLTVSTAHISALTAEYLNAGETFDLIVFDKGGYGWWFFVGDLPEDTSQVPQDLLAAINVARELGCPWLCLDQAADQLDDLPAYEW